jgi:23S rRNA (pseudouridine1915-N3)-methyltransferase
MKLLAIAIGKKHSALFASAIDAYSRRLSHYTTFEWLLVENAKTAQDAAQARQQESAMISSRLESDDYVILLDERGNEYSSVQLSAMLATREQQATRRIVFIIGGAFGVAESLRQRAHILWALSPLTFPHQLVRVMLAEQVYRAYTIARGEPYHHE